MRARAQKHLVGAVFDVVADPAALAALVRLAPARHPLPRLQGDALDGAVVAEGGLDLARGIQVLLFGVAVGPEPRHELVGPRGGRNEACARTCTRTHTTIGHTVSEPAA